MSQDELMKDLKRRVVGLLLADGMNVGTCDVAPGYTKNGAICKVTVEVLVPTETSEPYVDNVVEDMKGMSYMAVTLFALEELLDHFIPPGSSHHAHAMAAEIRRRRESLPSHSQKIMQELEDAVLSAAPAEVDPDKPNPRYMAP